MIPPVVELKLPMGHMCLARIHGCASECPYPKCPPDCEVGKEAKKIN